MYALFVSKPLPGGHRHTTRKDYKTERGVMTAFNKIAKPAKASVFDLATRERLARNWGK